MTVNRCLKTLNKRADHLAKRIASSNKVLSFDITELKALNYAIELIMGAYKYEDEEVVRQDDTDRGT